MLPWGVIAYGAGARPSSVPQPGERDLASHHPKEIPAALDADPLAGITNHGVRACDQGRVSGRMTSSWGNRPCRRAHAR
jgi:hypothetical protein